MWRKFALVWSIYSRIKAIQEMFPELKEEIKELWDDIRAYGKAESKKRGLTVIYETIDSVFKDLKGLF